MDGFDKVAASEPGNSELAESGPLITSGARSGAKLAAAVASKLVSDIMDAGWPVGEVIGSEAQLLERYGVSRAVLREAVRLLEHQGVAKMRRGPGGGLLVNELTVDSAISAVMVYLYYIGAQIDEVFEARLVLEESAAELAAERLSEDDLVTLRELAAKEHAGEVEDHRELHAKVAAATQNPAMEFLVDLLNRVTLLYTPEADSITADVRRASADAHGRIVESILEANASQAGYRMRRHLQAEADFISQRLPARLRSEAVLSSPENNSAKLAETVARQIFVDVTDGGWKAGEPLGAEPELMERFDISRAVLREAVRLLEHHQIARMRRGPGGGLFVSEPGIDAVAEAVALYLSQPGIEPWHLFEVRGIIEMAVLDRVIARLDDEVRDSLTQVLEMERSADVDTFPVVGHDFHEVLASLSGNRVLELLVDVMVQIARNRGRVPQEAEGRPLPTSEVMETHEAIVEAILSGDLDLARHRMRRHLGELIRWIG